MPRLSATRSRVPSNRITSGCFGADEHRLGALLGRSGHPGAEGLPGCLVGLFGSVGVGPHPGGCDDRVEPGPGDPVRIRGDLGVDLATDRDGQLSGGVGDLAADPRFHFPGLDPGPQTGQPVPQVQCGRDQRVCGVGGDAEHGAELGGGELGHLRGAGTAEPDQPFTAGQRPAARLRRRGDHGVQVGPMSGGVELGHLGGVQGSIGGSRIGQGGVGVHPVQILPHIEHVFDHTSLGTDTLEEPGIRCGQRIPASATCGSTGLDKLDHRSASR